MVPKKFRERFDEIVVLIDAFCDAHLNEEYKVVSCDLAEALCQKDSPVLSGKAAGWAAGVLHSVGFVNFLNDPQNTPHMTGKQIAAGFGVSEATLMAKSREIRSGLDITRFDPVWTVDSMLQKNPFIWMMEVDGLIIDVRHAPLEFQKKAFEAGWIPFIPTKRKPDGSLLTLAPQSEPRQKYHDPKRVKDSSRG